MVITAAYGQEGKVFNFSLYTTLGRRISQYTKNKEMKGGRKEKSEYVDHNKGNMYSIHIN